MKVVGLQKTPPDYEKNKNAWKRTFKAFCYNYSSLKFLLPIPPPHV